MNTKIQQKLIGGVLAAYEFDANDAEDGATVLC